MVAGVGRSLAKTSEAGNCTANVPFFVLNSVQGSLAAG